MTARAVWKGYLKFGELTCPVSLFTAVSAAERISLSLVSSGTAHGVKRVYVDSETGEEVPRDFQIKGYETSKDQYVTLEQDEIDAVAAQNDKTLHVTGFLPKGDADELFLSKPYFVAPQDAAARELYVLFREALAAGSVMAIAKATLFRRARTVALCVHDDGIVAEILRYNYEVRAAKNQLSDIGSPKITREMLSLAEHIIAQKQGSFDPAKFDDRYEAALAELVKAKMAGKKIPAPKPVTSGKVVNLLDALRRSAAPPPGQQRRALARRPRNPQLRNRAPGGRQPERALQPVPPQRRRQVEMGLATYWKKRDFSRTAEPRGGEPKKAKSKSLSFVVQKHAASRLHYDFRLEVDGVLKSWAVTKGPSLVPGDKRLAVHVEDHPIEYGDFEGTIPKGEYGGGSVILWDRGVWRSLHDVEKSFRKGHLEFELEGEKLRGRWHLVRMGHSEKGKRENWLLIKGDDEEARTARDADILTERPESVLTGRAVEDLEGEAPGWSSKTGRIKPANREAQKPKAKAKAEVKTKAKASEGKARQGGAAGKISAMPDFVEPALATLVSSAPTGSRFIHEIKFDGYRIQAHIKNGAVKLMTRSGLDWSKKFGPAITGALKNLVSSAILDGEIVVEGSGGASDFSALQAALSAKDHKSMVYYIFDLLYLDGEDLRALSQVERKERLEMLLEGAPAPLRYSAHFEESGELFLSHACRLSLEGMVSKLRDAPYASGRNGNWLKAKCSSRQEFVIGGFTPSSVEKGAIGALALGVYDKGKFRYVGRVGTGFPTATARALHTQLSKKLVSTSPFDNKLKADQVRQLQFVKPDLVAEVEFRGWTSDELLRHASFRGLREDKPASDVVRETSTSSSGTGKSRAKNAATKVAEPSRTVQLTHPDRVYWPDEGVTKEGLADYYIEVWRWAAPYLAGRPLALVRCPSGVNGEHFFQKHAWRGISKAISKVKDPAEPGEDFLAVQDLDGLLGLVQSATLEIHPWGARLSDWDHPDLITMDLDPGEGVEWSRVVKGAWDVKARLEAHGLAAFLKTSGGKGLHIVSPLQPRADWAEVKAFTKRIADEMSAEMPDEYVSTIAKVKRRGKILVDYLRNQRGATAVAPYSTRARPGAAVSMPLDWSELEATPSADHFTIMNTAARLAALAKDPWATFWKSAKPLPDKRVERKAKTASVQKPAKRRKTSRAA